MDSYKNDYLALVKWLKNIICVDFNQQYSEILVNTIKLPTVMQWYA